MAYDLTATLTQPLRSKYSGQQDKNVQRRTNIGVYNLFLEQSRNPTGVLDDDLRKQIKSSFGNTVGFPVVDYQNVTLGNVRTCAFQTGGLTSKIIPVTFATVSFGIAICRTLHDTNSISWELAFRKQLEANLQKVGLLLDTNARNFLELNKNQYFPADIVAYYAELNDALRVPLADQKFFYNKLNSIMATMDFEGQLTDVVTNPMGMASVRELAANGASQIDNTNFQLLGYNWHQSNRVTNGAGVLATGYAVAPGTVGFETRYNPEAVKNSVIGDPANPLNAWYLSENLPIINQTMDVYYQAKCDDITAWQAAGVTGMTNVKVESWQYAMDFCFIGAYNDRPTADYSPIVKFEFLNA